VAWKAQPSETELILLALAQRARTGAEIGVIFPSVTGHSVTNGSLYAILRRLRALGWIRVVDEDRADHRSYRVRITPNGRRALRRAAARHARLVEIARTVY